MVDWAVRINDLSLFLLLYFQEASTVNCLSIIRGILANKIVFVIVVVVVVFTAAAASSDLFLLSSFLSLLFFSVCLICRKCPLVTSGQLLGYQYTFDVLGFHVTGVSVGVSGNHNGQY